MTERRVPLQERAPPAPDFNEEKRSLDNTNMERHMAMFFADLSNNTDIQLTNPHMQSDQPAIKDQKPIAEASASVSASAETAKKIDKSKLDKISQLLASKKQEVNAASASASKVDINDKLKNLFQKNGLTGSVSSTSTAPAAGAAATTQPDKQNVVTQSSENVILKQREEYDPARPNDYEQLKRIINKQKQDLERYKNKKSLSEAAEEEQIVVQQPVTQKLQYNDDYEMEEEDVNEDEDDFRPAFGLGMKSNQMEIEKDTADLYSKGDYETSEEKAYKMMEKQGFKLGQGLGKNQQGIVAPIIAQKISDTSAIITQSTMDLSTILPQEVVMKRYFEQRKLVPTKVVCIINLVSPLEIDEDLEEEVTEECFQFGVVTNLKIYVMSAEDCEDAVRIFVKYDQQENFELQYNLYKQIA